MRNLKKVLALALATVMLLGMMAMASAADYKDEAAIDAKYDVAVDVMNAIGVFEGTKVGEDTYLYPTNTLTRAEAAKVIAYIALTKANASKLAAAEAPFADVAADHWAAASVAYAKNLGIVSGVGEDNYAPAGTLTGFQFAKMLLVVLGYNADIEGFKGAGWDNNVNVAALTTGLMNGLAINLADNITREQAAQMAFNALKADTVYYQGGTVLETGDTKITVGATRYTYTHSNESGYKATGNDAKQQLAEKLYTTLKLQNAADNSFGYSVKEWKYGTPAKTVATEKNYTVLATYAGTAAALTENALYDVIGVDNQAVRVYLNGADTTVDITADKGDATVITALATYKGATVEIVKNNGVYEALVTAATFGKVTEVVEATAMAKRYVKVDTDLDGTYDKTFETESYAKGDYVLAYLVGGVIKKMAAPTTVFGTLTQTAKTAGTISTLYIDGVAVPVAGATERATRTGYSAIAANALNKKYTVYMDNGYAVAMIIEAAAKATLTNYVYVYGGGNEYDKYNVVVDDYTMIEAINLADGTAVEIKADYDVDGFGVNGYTAGIYKVTASTTAGLKTLVPVLDEADKDDADKTYGAYAKDSYAKVANAKYVTGGTKAYFSENTQVLTITKTAGVTSGKLTALPAGAANFYNNDFTTSYVIFSETATDGIYEADLIVTLAAPALAAKDLYYVIGNEVGKVYSADAKTEYAQYVAYDVATGEKKTVMVTAPVATGFHSFTVNQYGAYTFADPAYGTNGAAANVGTAATIDVYGKYMTVSDTAVQDFDYSAAVVIDTTTKGKIATVADLNKYDASVEFAIAYVDGTTDKVVAIVVTAYTVA